jgi:hypothetical protein
VLFTGADLVRNSSALRDRVDSLTAGMPVRAVKPAESLDMGSSNDGGGGGNLIPFQRIGKPRPESRKPLPDLHRAFSMKDDKRGQIINLYI